MILYQLNCDQEHSFEAWFKDGDTCDRQPKRRSVECPVCGTAKVAKALMAPRISQGKVTGRDIVAVDPVSSPAAAMAAAGKMAVMPPEMRVMLKEVRKQIEANCDYVGDKFADEARKIHEGESEARGIYGEATEEQHQELIEDGIDVARVPWVPRDDA
jgi:hypothetical protein